MATGCSAPALVAAGDVGAAAGRSRAPTALSARTVPPDARTADRSVAATSDPPPLPSRRVAARGGRGGGRGRRRLVPALGGDGRDLIPGSSPVGARFRGRRVAVAAGSVAVDSEPGSTIRRPVRRGGGPRRLDRRSGRLDRRARHGRIDRRDGVTLGQLGRVGGVIAGFVMHVLAGASDRCDR